MLDRADTRVPVGQLAGIGFRISDQLSKGPNRHRGMHCDAENIGGDAGNRIQVSDRIVERPTLEQRLINVRLRPAEQDRVAVRLGAYDGGSTYRSAAATDVLNHDRGEQKFHLLCPWASDGVECATRRKR